MRPLQQGTLNGGICAHMLVYMRGCAHVADKSYNF